MTGDSHVRFCERFGLKCLCLLDYAGLDLWMGYLCGFAVFSCKAQVRYAAKAKPHTCARWGAQGFLLLIYNFIM
jgi:hypothetical protein